MGVIKKMSIRLICALSFDWLFIKLSRYIQIEDQWIIGMNYMRAETDATILLLSYRFKLDFFCKISNSFVFDSSTVITINLSR